MIALFLLVATGSSSAQSPPPATPSTDPVIRQPLSSVYVPEFIPMTQGERLRHYLKSTVSPETVLASAAAAGINQWRDSPEEWRLGGSGYAKRFGNAYARGLVRQTITYGISSVLHEDNRYIRSGDTSFGPRLKYALLSTVLARRDDGTRRLSVSRLGGTAGAAFISNEWQPPSTCGIDHACTNFGITMGTQAAFNVAREFLPHRVTRMLGD